MTARLLPYLLAAFIAILPMIMRPAILGAPHSFDESQANASGVAQAVIVQQQAVLSLCRSTTCSAGTVSQGSLTFSAPWSAPYGVSSCTGSTSLGPVAVTWYSDKYLLSGAVADAMTNLRPGASDTGVTGAQFLNSPAGSLIPLPTCAPAGVAAIADVITP